MHPRRLQYTYNTTTTFYHRELSAQSTYTDRLASPPLLPRREPDQRAKPRRSLPRARVRRRARPRQRPRGRERREDDAQLDVVREPARGTPAPRRERVRSRVPTAAAGAAAGAAVAAPPSPLPTRTLRACTARFSASAHAVAPPLSGWRRSTASRYARAISSRVCARSMGRPSSARHDCRVYGSGRRDDDDVDICAVESGRRRRRAAPRALLFGDGGAREDEASEKGVTACARGLLARA